MPIVIFMAAVAIAYIERTSIAHLIPYIRKDLAYDTAALGYVLSAFGWGYVVALPVSGFIITRFGHRRVLAAGAIAWVVAAAGFACATNLYELVVARFALGVAEAPLFPLFVSWIAITSGRNSTSAKIGVVEGISYLGMAFSGPLTVFAANNMGWRAAYAGVGLLALVVAAAALFLPNKSEPHASKSHSVTESRDAQFAIPFTTHFLCGICNRIPFIQFLQSVPFDMAADDSCRIIWLHVRIRSLGNIYPIYSGARCQRFESDSFRQCCSRKVSILRPRGSCQ